MASLAILAVAVIILACIQLTRTRYRRGLSSIPGPFIASFSNIWKVNAVYRADMPQRNKKVHEQYGPVVRIGPNHVSFASPQALHIIHGSRHAFPKSDFYEYSSPVYDGKRRHHLFSIQDISYHASFKKNVAGLYTKAAVRDFETHIDRCTNLLITQLSKMTSGKPAKIDMSLWLHLWAFDCLGELNVSKKFGFLETGTDVRGIMAGADRILHMTGLFGQSPFLHWLHGKLRAKKPNPIFLYGLDQVEERKKNPTSDTDMLNRFLEIHENQPDKLSVLELTGSIYINLMAGHDVLAITLRTILYYLSRYPRVLAKLREEIDSVSKKVPLSQLIPYSRIGKMAYLDATIYEALRIHAGIGILLERVVPPEGAVIDGYSIPGGTLVGVNAWVIHSNTDIFGEGVDAFRPERWLEASHEELVKMKANMFSFGAGPRKCIGQNIAMMQMSKLVVDFLRRFDATLAEPQKEWHVHGSWVTNQTDMDMIVTPLVEKS